MYSYCHLTCVKGFFRASVITEWLCIELLALNLCYTFCLDRVKWGRRRVWSFARGISLQHRSFKVSKHPCIPAEPATGRTPRRITGGPCGWENSTSCLETGWWTFFGRWGRAVAVLFAPCLFLRRSAGGAWRFYNDSSEAKDVFDLQHGPRTRPMGEACLRKALAGNRP